MRDLMRRMGARLVESEVFRSVYRSGYPDTSRNKVLATLGSVLLHLHPAKVSRGSIRLSYTFCLGGLSAFVFLLLVATGLLLMFYYVPSVERAYNDMQDLEFVVPFGLFLRNLHRWAAHAMVILVIAHMARVFYTGAYKPPRQFNWVVGVALLVLTLMLSFTGYLLPWDQLAYWAVTVGSNMARNAPVIGAQGPLSIAGSDSDLSFMLLGGRSIGQSALLRFYVWHCFALPLAATLLMAVHFWRVRKDGFSRSL
jgi:quinol-cytochrome oxidoreductase complex cytochrome b subunit